MLGEQLIIGKPSVMLTLAIEVKENLGLSVPPLEQPEYSWGGKSTCNTHETKVTTADNDEYSKKKD